MLARTGAKGEPMATPFDLIIKLTVKNKMSLGCSEKKKFFKFFCSDN